MINKNTFTIDLVQLLIKTDQQLCRASAMAESKNEKEKEKKCMKTQQSLNTMTSTKAA